MTYRLTQIRVRLKLHHYPPEHAHDDVEWLVGELESANAAAAFAIDEKIKAEQRYMELGAQRYTEVRTRPGANSDD